MQPCIADVGAVVQLVEYRTRNREVAGRVRLSPGPLQATLSKLLTYCVLRLMYDNAQFEPCALQE